MTGDNDSGAITEMPQGQPPKPPGERPGAAALLWVIAHALLCIALLIASLFVAPRFERVFKDFKMRLPVMAEITFAAVYWVNRYWYVLVLLLPWFLGVDGGVIYLLRRKRATSWLGAWWIALLTLLLFGMLLVGMLSVALSYWKLMEALSR